MADETRTGTRDRTEFGQRVLTARKHAGLTQSELGRLTGIGQSGIAYLETKGHASEKSWLIAHVCGVGTAWLAEGKGPMQGPATQLQVAREAIPEYLAPNSAKDYRTIVHTLAASLDHAGITLTVKEFLSLADEVFKKLGDR